MNKKSAITYLRKYSNELNMRADEFNLDDAEDDRRDALIFESIADWIEKDYSNPLLESIGSLIFWSIVFGVVLGIIYVFL